MGGASASGTRARLGPGAETRARARSGVEVGIATTGGVRGRATAEEGKAGCWGVVNSVVLALFAPGPGLDA